MATMIATREGCPRALSKNARAGPKRAEAHPRALRARAEQILAEELRLHGQPGLPPQEHRSRAVQLRGEGRRRAGAAADELVSADARRNRSTQRSPARPQLMKGAEERLMFLRFNYSQAAAQPAAAARSSSEGLTKELAEQFLEWHRRFEHFREYLVRTNLALVLAMAKRTRLGDVDFAEIVSRRQHGPDPRGRQVQRRSRIQVQHLRLPRDPQGVQPHGDEAQPAPHAFPGRVRAGHGKERLDRQASATWSKRIASTSSSRSSIATSPT